MAPRKSVPTSPPALADIQQRIVLVRQLVALSLEFNAKARTNAELAQAGLAELDTLIAHAVREGGVQ